MLPKCRSVFAVLYLSVVIVSLWGVANAQNEAAVPGGPPKTGYAVKKPVFGGACPVCPWGAMAEIVKAAVQPYGWDVQICYYCAGGPREARLVSAAAMATPPDHPAPDS